MKDPPRYNDLWFWCALRAEQSVSPGSSRTSCNKGHQWCQKCSTENHGDLWQGKKAEDDKGKNHSDVAEFAQLTTLETCSFLCCWTMLGLKCQYDFVYLPWDFYIPSCRFGLCLRQYSISWIPRQWTFCGKPFRAFQTGPFRVPRFVRSPGQGLKLMLHAIATVLSCRMSRLQALDF